MNTLTVVNQEIQIKEWNGQRVVTFKDIDQVHQRPESTARQNFNRNKEHFIEGVDYFVCETYEAKKRFNYAAPNGLILLTESGYLMLVKSFTDDLAWEVQRTLVNCYFRVKEEAKPNPALSPELLALKYVVDIMTKSQIEQAEIKRKVDENTAAVDAAHNAVTAIKETFVQRDDDWRKWANAVFAAAVEASGTEDYQALRRETYEVLESRAHCDLTRRLDNLRRRMAEAGATKTRLSQTTKLDVIESDCRLKEIYTVILKELSLRYRIEEDLKCEN